FQCSKFANNGCGSCIRDKCVVTRVTAMLGASVCTVVCDKLTAGTISAHPQSTVYQRNLVGGVFPGERQCGASPFDDVTVPGEYSCKCPIIVLIELQMGIVLDIALQAVGVANQRARIDSGAAAVGVV